MFRGNDLAIALVDSKEATFFTGRERPEREVQSSLKISKTCPLFFALNKVLNTFQTGIGTFSECFLIDWNERFYSLILHSGSRAVD